MPESEGGNFFTQKVGPLPLWAWAALALSALLAFWYLRKSGPFAGSGGGGAAAQGGTPALSGVSGSLPSMLGGQGVDPGVFVNGRGGNPTPPFPAIVQPGAVPPIVLPAGRPVPQPASPRGSSILPGYSAGDGSGAFTTKSTAAAPVIQVPQ